MEGNLSLKEEIDVNLDKIVSNIRQKVIFKRCGHTLEAVFYKNNWQLITRIEVCHPKYGYGHIKLHDENTFHDLSWIEKQLIHVVINDIDLNKALNETKVDTEKMMMFSSIGVPDSFQDINNILGLQDGEDTLITYSIIVKENHITYLDE